VHENRQFFLVHVVSNLGRDPSQVTPDEHQGDSARGPAGPHANETASPARLPPIVPHAMMLPLSSGLFCFVLGSNDSLVAMMAVNKIATRALTCNRRIRGLPTVPRGLNLFISKRNARATSCSAGRHTTEPQISDVGFRKTARHQAARHNNRKSRL
jgi:hypothetical protein